MIMTNDYATAWIIITTTTTLLPFGILFYSFNKKESFKIMKRWQEGESLKWLSVSGFQNIIVEEHIDIDNSYESVELVVMK